MGLVINSKQLALSDWFSQIKHKDTEALRMEDKSKRERLDILSRIIQIKYDKATNFSAVDFNEEKNGVKEFLESKGDELCALRLVPKDPSLSILRIRGKSVKESIPWFKEQKIDYSKYEVHIVPHAEPLYSTIFIVNESGIQGEIIRGMHAELTQGYTTSKTLTSYFNFKEWNFSHEDNELAEHMKKIVNQLIVSDEALQEKIKREVNGEFTNNYLQGYFETTSYPNDLIWFIDYNRLLHKNVPSFSNIGKVSEGLSGQIASPGRVQGNVKIITDLDIASKVINEDDILVCAMTSIDYLPLMVKARAIVTDKGGILSHAAIVSRELKKPCIVGVGNATALLKEGELIEVNANEGKITVLK